MDTILYRLELSSPLKSALSDLFLFHDVVVKSEKCIFIKPRVHFSLWMDSWAFCLLGFLVDIGK